jgi:hypothetical protein
MKHGTGLFEDTAVLGLPGLTRVLDEALIHGFEHAYFKDFNPEVFLRVRS